MMARDLHAGMAALCLLLAACTGGAHPGRTTWMADNGDGTFTNPLFYDEFSDPDMIRVGDTYYLTGTTMHAMPGLPILRSQDLVNWSFVGYALDRLDLGPEYRLEGGDRYGQGIWAPSLRYHDGVFHIFTNVNGQATFHLTARDPAGPWKLERMNRSFHDLSVLFDDDGKVYVAWGYQGIRLAQLNPELTDIVPGTEREIISPEQGMGEGLHFTKVDDRYWITSAWYEGAMRMPVARSTNPWGPYEVNREISAHEDYGLAEGNRLKGKSPPFLIVPSDPRAQGRTALHQGGYVQTLEGKWWGFSMMDYNSVGRLTSLSPVTWQDGWPYFGLPGNLGRTPRTWLKPEIATRTKPHAPYVRGDDFSSGRLGPIWQWNHVPLDTSWSLTERPGYLRLHTLPARDFWNARNTLTQRSIGPLSRPTVEIDGSGLQVGDVAGLGLLSQPYAWIGLEKSTRGLEIVQFDQQTGRSDRVTVAGSRFWFRADADFMTEQAIFSYSENGKDFHRLGKPMTMVFQLRTFQGVRYGLFAFNQDARAGGVVDFNGIAIHESSPNGLRRPIPLREDIQLRAGTVVSPSMRVLSRGHGRVALRTSRGILTVLPDGQVEERATPLGDAQTFQWMETPDGRVMLMSLSNHRYLTRESAGGWSTRNPGATSQAPTPSAFDWNESDTE